MMALIMMIMKNFLMKKNKEIISLTLSIFILPITKV